MRHRMLLLFILALLPLVFPACRMQETGGEDVIVEEIHYQLFSEAPLDLSDPFFQGKLDTISLDPEGPEDFSVSNADKVVVFGKRHVNPRMLTSDELNRSVTRHRGQLGSRSGACPHSEFTENIEDTIHNLVTVGLVYLMSLSHLYNEGWNTHAV